MKKGGAYPKEGSLDLVHSLVCTIQKFGGVVMVKAGVQKIII